VTCSADNEVKYWNIEQGVEVRALNVNIDGKEKVENQ
jgi:WD40 repeat protein